MPRSAPVSWTAFLYGFISLVAQTLLARTFFSVCEGSELSFAVFFGGWLGWTALGAAAGRHPRLPASPQCVLNLLLLYVPAILLQQVLFLHARSLAGVPAYALFPLDRLVGVSLLITAPVSLLTGLLFTLASRARPESEAMPVSRVYAWESIGGMGGGLYVTALLILGVSDERLLALAAVGLWAGWAGGSRTYPRRRWWIPGLALAGLVFGLDTAWMHYQDSLHWRRLMPTALPDHAFTTPRGRYAVGWHEGQCTVTAHGTVLDQLPDKETTSTTAALHLAQHPAARRILVLGPGSYSLAVRLLALPALEQVTWLETDPDYARGLLKALPPDLLRHDARLHVPGQDPLAYLQQDGPAYDLVILALPEAVSLEANRYHTREFFQQVRHRLAEDGVVGLRVTGGENILQDVQAQPGASAYRTLGEVFPYLAIQPGEPAWVLASPVDGLSEEPAVLRDRFQSIPGAASLYPPEAVFSLYPPDRCAFTRKAWETATVDDPAKLLLNTAQEPRALLHALLLSLRQSSALRIRPGALHQLVQVGIPLLVGMLILYLLLRLVYLRGRGGGSRAPPRAWDWLVLTGAGGSTGMALYILLLFRFQVAFGSLYLWIGALTALFMLGLAIGSRLLESILSRHRAPPRYTLPILIAVHLLLLTFTALVLQGILPAGLLGCLFPAAGLLTGLYIPLANDGLKRAGHDTPFTAAGIEAADALGGATGAFLFGLVLLPCLGSQAALVFHALGIPLLCIPVLAGRTARAACDTRPAWARPAGFLWFGTGLILLWGGWTWTQLGDQDRTASLTADLHRLKDDADWIARRHTGTEWSIPYFESDEEATDHRWIFHTAWSTETPPGYGGPVILGIRLHEDHTLEHVLLLSSRETPAYLERVDPWLDALTGHPLSALPELDGVSGATLTIEAIRGTLARAVPQFGRAVLGWQAPIGSVPPPTHGASQALQCWIFLGLAALAVLLRRRPRIWIRRAFLLLVVLLVGFTFNQQFSSAQVLVLASGRLPNPAWSPAFLTVVIVPVLVILFGNIYCGWLCPFGALQELLSDAAGATARQRIDPHDLRRLRLVKYALLGGLILLFAVTRREAATGADPLVTFFGSAPGTAALGVGIALLLFSSLVPRAWCRTLCPAGALLSLLGRLRLVRPAIPRMQPAHCRFGVESTRELDCLQCDRCRMPPRPTTTKKPCPMGVRAALVLGVVAAIWWLTARAWELDRTEHAHETPTRLSTGAAGQTRPVDVDRLQRMIREGRLSDQEALYVQPHTAP